MIPHTEIAETSNKKAHRLTLIVFMMLLAAYFIPVNLLGSRILIPTMQTVTLLFFLVLQPGLTAPRHALGVAIGFSVLMILLTIFAIVVDFPQSIYRDYAEIGKYGLVFLAFIAGTFMSNEPGIDRDIVTSFAIAACIFTAMGLSESIFRSSGEFITDIYGRDMSILRGKPIISLWTTYFAASFYTFISSILIASVATFKSKWHSHFLIMGMFSLILLTQSRSGFFALIVLTLIYLVAISVRYGRQVALILLSSAAVLTVMLFALAGDIIADRLSYLIGGIERYLFGFFEHADGENSLGYRIDQLSWSLGANTIVILGQGIGKGYNEYLESFPALFYYRYGIVGIAAYAITWGTPAAHLLLSLVRKRQPDLPIMAMGIFSLTLPFLSISSVVTDQIYFLSVYYVFLGIWYGRIFKRQRTQDLPSRIEGHSIAG